eukprot:gene1764-1926_t
MAGSKLSSPLIRHMVNNDWVNREGEVISVYIGEDEPTLNWTDRGIFDRLGKDEEDPCAISTMSLREISMSYNFCIDYLGDFACQLGCTSPIDVDSGIGNYMTGDQISQLMEALNSLDPYLCNSEYQSSLGNISDDLGVSIEELISLCAKQNIPLPYGEETVLHETLVDQLRRAVEFNSDGPI